MVAFLLTEGLLTWLGLELCKEDRWKHHPMFAAYVWFLCGSTAVMWMTFRVTGASEMYTRLYCVGMALAFLLQAAICAEILCREPASLAMRGMAIFPAFWFAAHPSVGTQRILQLGIAITAGMLLSMKLDSREKWVAAGLLIGNLLPACTLYQGCPEWLKYMSCYSGLAMCAAWLYSLRATLQLHD